MQLRDYLKNSILVTDGAMGTYYSKKTLKDTTVSELANINDKKIIETIHKEYIEAGAKLIRTNTFSANTVSLKCSRIELRKIITEGYNIAVDSAKGKDVFVGASIGPIPEKLESEKDDILDEYYCIINTLLDLGADIFIFETFASTNYIKILAAYILSKNEKAEIIAQFKVNAFGYSKEGISARRLIEEARGIEGLVAYGFNCGIGVGHLYKIIRNLDIEDENIVAIPNAGYPDKIYARTVYRDNARYFGETMVDIKKLGVKVIGGCCGTTPSHIEEIIENLEGNYEPSSIYHRNKTQKKKGISNTPNRFYKKLMNKEFVFAVELDPPYNGNIQKTMEGANILKAEGVDIITIADSPLSRPRADSIIIANKIAKEVGIDVMPHICCRDKNVIALKSIILGAHIEKIRNILLVTGDPIPSEERIETASVFNVNSIKLMELVKELNVDFDPEDAMIYGGALNPNLTYVDKIIKRINKKQEAGAKYLLTQPIYNDQAINNLKIIKENTDIKILGGIMPLVSYKNARFLNNEIAGIDIPENICSMFTKDMTREEAENVGIEIAVEIAMKIKDIVDGIYMMTPFNRVEMVSKIIKSIR
ncbi:bifunctional homocysteine S-methyltransferase/methylenetetrahydrofolate reductase [Vallitalea guaymasensis]|uniref:Bifunctional homocysteine S-methyltransferase/methylenetetrahydrofolate reductase n=1 Tax=Vallitalea guaymasensis TaxID=1185412 RepID=A0A8J8SDL3_9FIRM|nr:bifunctional homocysteine S-methyltransferase/methylenetetrahydrofolate reductase [Vallitalea guaymasensis]QUH30937.1 bifunctional homocysteine S-methyltransferase/methylenetetrahydrofolate reductase [Vallitalea guaymasensis]